MEKELRAPNPIKSSMFKLDIVSKLPLHEAILMSDDYINTSNISNNSPIVKFKTMLLVISSPAFKQLKRH